MIKKLLISGHIPQEDGFLHYLQICSSWIMVHIVRYSPLFSKPHLGWLKKEVSCSTYTLWKPKLLWMVSSSYFI